jgi:TolA-binding protein
MSRTRAAGTVLCTLLGSLLLLSSSAALAKKKKAAQPQGDFQPDSEPTGDQPSKVLERAFKLYDGEDYYSASIELNKAIEGETGDVEANKQKAEFWMGKALYNLTYYSASLSFFDRIVQKGPSHA